MLRIQHSGLDTDLSTPGEKSSGVCAESRPAGKFQLGSKPGKTRTWEGNTTGVKPQWHTGAWGTYTAGSQDAGLTETVANTLLWAETEHSSGDLMCLRTFLLLMAATQCLCATACKGNLPPRNLKTTVMIMTMTIIHKGQRLGSKLF